MSRRYVTLQEAVTKIVKRHGGIRAASRATEVDSAFISRLMRGERVNPSAKTLDALGLGYQPRYEVLRREPDGACGKDPRGCWSVRCQLGGKCKDAKPTKRGAA